MRKGIFLLVAFIYLSGCGHMARSTQSGYYSSQDSNEFARTPQSEQFTQANLTRILAEQGMTVDDLKTDEGFVKVQNALEIKKLEARMTTEREKKQYYKTLPWLKDENEQVEFLRQGGYFARQAWIRKRGIGKRSTEIDKAQEDMVATKDISVGMPNELVRRSWGAPDSIDVAGNPIYGNERWRYKRYTPSPDGYRLQSRIIYFESGKVVGWEQVDH
ncbi:MAG: hypothetical protein RJB66_2080 [Pseudomonadota bacterium]|jgi:hypothetical protein